MDKLTLAKEFSTVLKTWLTEEQMADVIRLNSEEDDDSVCHSHDFCDANMAMDEAFKNVMKREFDFESDEDAHLFNEAWDEAKENKFFAFEIMTHEAFTKACFDHCTGVVKYAAEAALEEDENDEPVSYKCELFVQHLIEQDSDKGSRSGTERVLGTKLYKTLQSFK